MAKSKSLGAARKNFEMQLLQIFWVVDIVVIFIVITKGLFSASTQEVVNALNNSYLGALSTIMSVLALVILVSICYNWIKKVINKQEAFNRIIQLFLAVVLFDFAFVVGFGFVTVLSKIFHL